MPMYDYTCGRCERRFEAIVSASTMNDVRCPGCGAAEVHRHTIAAFAVGGGRKEAAPVGGCGRCGDPRGPGACAMD
jgi:putative FmdB family regulatory protein